MKIRNLTPHVVSVADEEGKITHTFPPVDLPARIEVEEVSLPWTLHGAPIIAQRWKEVINLPAPQEGTIYIVSTLVRKQLRGRPDVVSPDTGPTAVRDGGGNVIAVRRFVGEETEK